MQDYYTDYHREIYPQEYLKGIDLFNASAYYEAHEAWEDIWREAQAEERLFYQGLIQTAAALLHYDRDNLRGVNLCMKNALAKLESLPAIFMSLDLPAFMQQLRMFVGDALEDESSSVSKNVAQPHPTIRLLEK